MVQSCSMPQWRPLTALAASGLAFFLLPVVAAGLKLRAGPAPAPTGMGAPAPAPAGIRPGIVVQITKSKEKLQNDFSGATTLHYVHSMDEMLGKTYVVKEMKYDGVGLPSPNGSQDQVWYFPLASLTPWVDTAAAKEVPVSSKAFKAVGLPTRARIVIDPPGRHDAPWEYTTKGQRLMDPIAPPDNQQIDLEKTSMPRPTWNKVKQVSSVECLEKLHKDPSHLCNPEAYTSYKNLVTPTPTTEKPLTEQEAKVMRDKIKHLQTTVDSLTPKDTQKYVRTVRASFKVPSVQNEDSSIPTAVADSNRQASQDVKGKKIQVGGKASDERLSTAQGHGEKDSP